MSKEIKKTVTLTTGRGKGYYVDSTKNTLTPEVEGYLTEKEVQALIDDGVEVIIKRERK